MSSRKSEPPVVLVRTWYQLLSRSEDSEAKDRAVEMLTGAFGDMKTAAEFIKRHKIA